MRKMFMRMCRGVDAPGGPCALEINTATEDVWRVTTAGTASGTAKLPDRLDASVTFNETALGVVRECTAQCGQNPEGWLRATALGSGLDTGSFFDSIDSMCPIAISPMSWCDMSDSAWRAWQETSRDRRCGQRAAIRKSPAWLKSSATARTVTGKNRLFMVRRQIARTLVLGWLNIAWPSGTSQSQTLTLLTPGIGMLNDGDVVSWCSQ